VDEVNISVSGVTKDDALKRAWFSRERMGFARFVYDDGSEISGQFYLTSYTDTGPYEDALTFEAEFQSSDVVNYNPATT
jgi:predicted secreted protein